MGSTNSKAIEESLNKLKKDKVTRQNLLHFFDLLLSDRDIAVITHKEIREIFIQKPENILSVFYYILDYFELFVNDYSVYDRWEVLCRVKVMTRIISVLNEPAHEEFSFRFFWETWKKDKNMQIGKFLVSLLFKMFFIPNFTIEEINKNKYKRYVEKEFSYINWSIVWFVQIHF
jgi:hypothetical protein